MITVVHGAKFDIDKICNVKVDGIDTKDYPDFCDAYITYAEWEDGTPLTEKELDKLCDEYSDFVYDCVQDKIY